MGYIWPEIFEAYIFGCVSVRAVELLTQVLWILKFLHKKSWWSRLHVRSAIDRFSHSLIHLLVDLMGQSLISISTVELQSRDQSENIWLPKRIR